MLRFLTLLMVLCLALPASAQEAPGPNQKRAPGGMTASDGIAPMLADLYAESVARGGWPRMRYFSRRLQAEIAEDLARPIPRVEATWLIHPDVPWSSDQFYAWVLNTTGASADGPASATVSIGVRNTGWGRRLHLIDEGGYWVIGEVCLFPGSVRLSDALEAPGPSEPGHDPRPNVHRGC